MGISRRRKLIAGASGPARWSATLLGTSAAATATAVTGAVATDAGSHWYRTLRKPSWQPPATAFPVVWTALYADIAVTSAAVIVELSDAGDRRERAGFVRALALNLVLNAGWTAVFFRARRPDLATVEAAALALSSIDLARRASRAGTAKGLALAPYAAWTCFAAALSGSIAARNPEQSR